MRTSDDVPRKPDTVSHLAYSWVTLKINDRTENFGETYAQKRYLLLCLSLQLSGLPTKPGRSTGTRIWRGDIVRLRVLSSER